MKIKKFERKEKKEEKKNTTCELQCRSTVVQGTLTFIYYKNIYVYMIFDIFNIHVFCNVFFFKMCIWKTFGIKLVLCK